jgi:hypothetical protein
VPRELTGRRAAQGATNHGGATDAANPDAGWIEATPTNDAHYFGNAVSGDTGGFNAWSAPAPTCTQTNRMIALRLNMPPNATPRGVQDDTSDGGAHHAPPLAPSRRQGRSGLSPAGGRRAGIYHGFSLNLAGDTNAAAFQTGWVATTRAKLVSGTQVRARPQQRTTLLLLLDGGGCRTELLPYRVSAGICTAREGIHSSTIAPRDANRVP